MNSQILSNQWVVRGVTLVLLGALAYQSARLFWQLFTPATTISLPTLSVKTIAPLELPPIHFATANATTATGKATHQIPQASKQQLSNWSLKGTYVADNEAFAILQTEQNRHVVGLGERLDNGLTIKQISHDKIVLVSKEANDKPIELRLNDNTITAVRDNTVDYTQTTIRPTLIKPARQTTDKSSGLPSEQWQQLKSLAWQAVSSDGQIAYKITATSASEKALLAQYGLQSDDIILSLNGQALHPDMLKTLSFAKKISAKIRRNATIQTIEINLTP